MSVGNLLSLNFYPCDQGQITCNNNGNIWRQTVNVNNGAAQASQEYRYDALNRLTMAEEKTATWTTGPACPDTTAVWTQQNTFDPAGNRTAGCRGGLSTMNGEVAAFNAANNRIADGGWSYDAAGNITAGWMARCGKSSRGRSGMRSRSWTSSKRDISTGRRENLRAWIRGTRERIRAIRRVGTDMHM
jgi:hypothetical protein